MLSIRCYRSCSPRNDGPRKDLENHRIHEQQHRSALLATSSALDSEAPVSDRYDWSSLCYIGGVSLVALHFAVLPFVAPAFRKYCLPYVAANDIQLKMLTNSLREHNVKRVVDLGSGDGVVCIHLAKELGIKTAGYELNPWLVVFSRTWAWYSGVGNLCSFHQRDLFKADVSKDDGVVLFVVPSMMDALEEKLKNELKDDAKVYALRFPLNTWKEEHYESGPPTGGYNVNQLWVYPSRQRQMSGVQSPAPLKQSSGTK